MEQYEKLNEGDICLVEIQSTGFYFTVTYKITRDGSKFHKSQHDTYYVISKLSCFMLQPSNTHPLDIPPPAENPPLGRSTTFITKSTFPASIPWQETKFSSVDFREYYESSWGRQEKKNENLAF